MGKWEEGADRSFFKGCVEELSNENIFALAAAGEVKSTGWRSARWHSSVAGIYAAGRAFPPEGYK